VRRAIASAREVECRRIGGDRATCHSRFFEENAVPQEDGAFLGDSPRAAPAGAEPADRGVVMCHNPVAATDHRACREVGYSVRLGDIRYNHITYWPGNSRAPFGGIAHWGYDPLTGEVVSNGAMNMGRSVEYAAGQQRDFVRLIMNSIDPTAESLTVDQYSNNAPGAVLAQFLRNPGGTRIGSTDLNARVEPAEIADRARALTLAADGQQLAQDMPNFGNDLREGIRAYQQITRDMVPVAQDPSGNAMRFHVQASQMARRLQNTQYEADLLDPNTLRLMGAGGSFAGLSDDALNRASPLRMMDPETIGTAPRPAGSASRTPARPPRWAPMTSRAWPAGSSRSTATSRRRSARRASFRISASTPTRASRSMRSATRSGSITSRCRATTR
jgi:hypothetical protein